MSSYYEYSEASTMPKEDKFVEGMYLKTIARKISEGAKKRVKPNLYKPPPDPPALRMALDFVSSWLAVRNLDITLDLANYESNKLVKIDRHRPDYVARNLDLKRHKGVIRQLLKLKQEQKAENPTVKSRAIPSKKERENPLLQSSDDSEFSENSIVEEAEAKREEFYQHNQKHHHSKHHHHSQAPVVEPPKERDISEDDTFTQSSDEEQPQVWDPHYGLDKEKRNALQESLARKASRKSSKKPSSSQKKESEPPQSSYSYYSYGDTYSYTQTEKNSRRHEPRREKRPPTYSENSYSYGDTYTYSYSIP